MPTFAVTAVLPGRAPEMLAAVGDVRADPSTDRLARADLLALVDGVDVVVTMLYDRIDDELLDAAGPRLRGVCNVAVGFDNIDLAACARRGVVVTNTPGVLDDATADLAFALILAATRRLGEGERLIRAGRPWAWGMNFMVGQDLRGGRLGIVGLGGIGSRVAVRGRAFGMEIAYHSRNPSPHAAELEATRLDLDELLATSDVVSLHTPLTEGTRHLIGARELALMKPTATLVNAARGAVVDEPALAAALRDGQIAAAGLDVYEHEPDVLPALLELENVVLLPHIGSSTSGTRDAMAELAARNAIAIVAGEDPPTPVPLPVAG
ncbi:MAG TPA: D-glycerate dehydrogenase [Solirubrobacterales bacterium]|jgi:glyoxylate reductase|nr:D-glycerate dehydrogenase [Solirubrobacterales bacterium]